MNRIPSEDFPDLVYPICAIRDSLAHFYPPTCEETTRSAVRNFSMAVNGASGSISFSPADFTLFHVGNFNVEKGTIEPVIPIVQLANGAEMVGVNDEKS